MRLQVTRRTDYAIGACVLLAASATCPVPSRLIADRMGIPATFLPQVLADLQRAGIVDSRSGKAGGHCLTRDATRISILELIEAVEGRLDAPRAAGLVQGLAVLDPMWDEARAAYASVLATTTLAEVAGRWAATEGLRGAPAGSPVGPAGPERIPA